MAGITQKHLTDLEDRQNTYRHKLRDDLQLWQGKVDDIIDKVKTDNTILQESAKYMQKVVDRLEATVNKFIDHANDNFATKEDHKVNSEKIAEIEKGQAKINIKIATVSGVFTAVIYFIDKFWK